MRTVKKEPIIRDNKPRGFQVKKGGPTPLQKAAIDNMMSGEFKSKQAAMRAAGYSDSHSTNPHLLLRAKGSQKYLENFETKALIKFGMTLESKIQEVYLEGLVANKPYGKKMIVDYEERRRYAKNISEMLGLLRTKERKGHQTYNFFMLDSDQKNEFNEAFKEFIKIQSV